MTSRTRLHELLVVAGLSGFAFSQPVLSVLGENPTVFTREGVVGGTLVVFVVLLALLPPLVLWGIGALTSAVNHRLGSLVHLGTVGTLVALTAVQLLKQAGDLSPAVLVLGALGAAVLFVGLYDGVGVIAMWARFTAPLPLLAMTLFLVSSPAGALVRPAVADPSSTAATDASIVFIVLDEFPTRSLLRDDATIDPARFPNLAAFAEGSTWYRRFTAMSPFTTSSVPSLLSGRRPIEGSPDSSTHPDSLFGLLTRSHRYVVSEHATALCTFTACDDPTIDATADVGSVIDTAVDIWSGRVSVSTRVSDPLAQFAEDVEAADSGAEVVDDARVLAMPTRVERFVDSFRAGRPGLYFLHAMVPHQPWITWPDGTAYTEPDPAAETLEGEDLEHRYSWNAWDARVAEQRHVLQAQYADGLVGQIISGLRTAGIYDESLVVIVSDHGASFEVGTNVRRVTRDTLDAIAYVPLLVKAPGQAKGVVSDANLMSMDVMPTIADLLDIDLGWEVDGVSAASSAISDRGSTKSFYRFENLYDPHIEEVIEFDDEVTFPQVAASALGPLDDAASPLAGLYGDDGLGDLIGRSVDSFSAEAGGRANVFDLDRVRERSADEPPMAVVQGEVVVGPGQGNAMIAIDDVVVAASPLSVDGRGRLRFTMLIEPSLLDEATPIRLLVVDQGVTAELELSG